MYFFPFFGNVSYVIGWADFLRASRVDPKPGFLFFETRGQKAIKARSHPPGGFYGAFLTNFPVCCRAEKSAFSGPRRGLFFIRALSSQLWLLRHCRHSKELLRYCRYSYRLLRHYRHSYGLLRHCRHSYGLLRHCRHSYGLLRHCRHSYGLLRHCRHNKELLRYCRYSL